MTKEIEITVRDGEQVYTCKVHRPDVATLSRVNKLSKTDEVLAAQDMMMAAVGQMGELSKGVTAEIKN